MSPRAKAKGVAAAILAAALLALPVGAADGPPYRDPKRGVQKQTEAAAAARDVARKGKEAAKDVLVSLGDDSGVVRDAVFLEILKWSAEDLAALQPGLELKDEIACRNVAEAFGRKRVASARKSLETLLKRRKEPGALVEIARALGEIGDPESAKELELALRAGKDPWVSDAALVAVTKCDPKGAVARLEKAFADEELSLRISALLRLAELDEPRAAAAALAAVKTKDQLKPRGSPWIPRLLFAALDTLSGLKDRGKSAPTIKEAIDALIPRIDIEEGRARHEVCQTLRSLTGEHDIADEKFAWESWWKVQRDSFDPSKVKPRPKGEGGGAGDGAGGTVVRYHGIPIYSKRVCFMLDLSGGMDRVIDDKVAESPRRLDYAKKELAEVLRSLDEDVAVNIIFFSSTYDSAAKELVPLKRSRRAFIDFVSKQEIPETVHMNRGNIYDPLVLAMDDPSIDTVFLLSEGNPTEGLFQDKDRFVFHMSQRNRLAQTRVFTLFIGSAGSARGYVRAIAEATGGDFHDVATR